MKNPLELFRRLFVNEKKKTARTSCKKQKPQSLFLRHARKVMEEKKGEVSQSTIANYAVALNSFSRFLNDKDVATADINCNTMQRYERWMEDNGICRNTSSCYMRSIRTLYNCVTKKWHIANKHPFENVFTGNAATAKRDITINDIKRIENLKLDDDSKLKLTQDIFMFCFYAMGMPFVDAVHLKQAQVRDSHIIYYRQKTRQCITVKIEPCIRRIINRYESKSRKFLFPILPENDEGQNRKLYCKALATYNRNLDELAKAAGIDKHLTSYVARHTWASIACKNDVDMNVISRALGHTSIKTTQIYIGQTCDNAVAKACQKVIRIINKKTL